MKRYENVLQDVDVVLDLKKTRKKRGGTRSGQEQARTGHSTMTRATRRR